MRERAREGPVVCEWFRVRAREKKIIGMRNKIIKKRIRFGVTNHPDMAPKAYC